MLTATPPTRLLTGSSTFLLSLFSWSFSIISFFLKLYFFSFLKLLFLFSRISFLILNSSPFPHFFLFPNISLHFLLFYILHTILSSSLYLELHLSSFSFSSFSSSFSFSIIDLQFLSPLILLHLNFIYFYHFSDSWNSLTFS